MSGIVSSPNPPSGCESRKAKAKTITGTASLPIKCSSSYPNNGMRVGEVVKVRRKDFRFYERKLGDKTHSLKRLGALVQVHKSTKTGAREVNSMGGEFAMRVYEKATHKRKDDFLFQRLDGSPFTSRQFGTLFRKIMKYTDQEEIAGKRLVSYSLRHMYATTRLQQGT